MEFKGFQAKIMEAERLVGDTVFGLPPGKPLPVYPVDAFVKCPENWMKGPGVYVVPVRPNKGLWFDWRLNSKTNTAVIPTVKGCNPITGLQTSGFHLEGYEKKCPKHGCDFTADRFCPDCNYKWPDRNYVSSSGDGELWWDGFRAGDGTVRQFFFTEDELRDISSALIGKENTIPAFGFAFYSPKERRPESAVTYTNGYLNVKLASNYKLFYYSDTPTVNYMQYSSSTAQGITDIQGPQGSPGVLGHPGQNATVQNENIFYTHTSGIICPPSSSEKATRSKKLAASSASMGLISDGQLTLDSASINFLAPIDAGSVGLGTPYPDKKLEVICSPQPVKEVSIGAGAKIRQDLPIDTYALETWRSAPDAVMTIYFVFEEHFNEIKKAGMHDLSQRKEGMLAGLSVG